MEPLYRTRNGVLYLGDAYDMLEAKWFKPLKHKFTLIFTSPPFPLNKKKAYGNLNGQEYIDWLSGFADIFKELLKPEGSLVVELGNAWVPGSPTMSLLPIESLIELKKKGDFHLCQEFIYHNTTRLPSPAQWVNVERIRVKDAFTRLWWLSPSEKPKANNKHVLNEYSPSMKRLLKNKKYNPGKRPSEHRIGEKSFLKDNKGSIPSNVISIPNTISSGPYLNYCRENNIKYHPARMPLDLAEFFIKFLTEPDDLVLDPFAGSNVTGYVAEELGRRWRSIEKKEVYALSSKSRFSNAWFIKPYKKG
ncbi:MAG: DNA-methyltransferase [Candidatus Hodarchaeales archaeon]